MKKIALLLVLALVLPLLPMVGLAEENFDGEIVVGAAAMLTGAESAAGLMMVNGIQLAFDEINAAGGIYNKKLVIKAEDCGDSTDLAINAVNKLLSEDDVVAIIGPHLSTMVFAVESLVKEGNKPVLVGGTNPGIPALQADNLHLFGVRTNDSIVALNAAEFLVNDLGAKKIAVFNSSDDFGTGGAKVGMTYFDEMGIPYINEVYNGTDTDLSSCVINAMNEGCDSAFIWSLVGPYVILARQMYEFGFKVPTVTSPALADKTAIDMSEIEWLDGWYGVTEFFPASPSEVVQNFNKNFEAKYGMQPDNIAAYYYGAGILLIDALQRTEYPFTTEAIEKSLLSTEYLEAPGADFSARPDVNHQLAWDVNIVHRNMYDLELAK